MRVLNPTMIVFVALVATSAYSQPTKLRAPVEDTERKDGWTFVFKIGANLAWNYAQDFIGAVNGNSLNLGGQAEFGSQFNQGRHEWRNRVLLAENFVYAPPLNQFVKSADQLSINSIYLYHILPWFGAFGLGKMRTSVFPGRDLRLGDVEYQISDIANPSAAPQLVTANQLELTTPFMPLILEEQAGLFAQPLREKYAFLEFRAGGALRETFGVGQRVITGSTDTTVQVTQLATMLEAGPAVGLTFKGSVVDDKISYLLEADAMESLWQWPIAQAKTDFLSRLNVEVLAGLSFKLLQWLSLDWQFKAIRQPLVLDKFQILSNLLLTASYTL